MKTTTILSFLIVLVLILNITEISVSYNVIYSAPEEANGEAIQDRPIDGQGIIETIKQALRNFWEVVRPDRLLDILIDFFRGIWEWAKNVFGEGIERGRE